MDRTPLARACLLATLYAAAFAVTAPAWAENPGVIVDWGGQTFEGWSGIPANSPDGRALAPRFDSTRPAPPVATERSAETPPAAAAAGPANPAPGRTTVAKPPAEARPTGAHAQAALPESGWEVPEYQLMQAAPAAAPADPARAGPRHDPPDHELPGVWPERAVKTGGDRPAQ